MSEPKKKRRTRIDCKINQLPPDVKQQVDEMLSDTSISYQYISLWLLEQGHEISYSAVCRYASHMNKAAQRIADDLARTQVILDYIKRNPEVDPAKAAQAIMTSGLMQRVSMADEEFFEMPLDKAGRLIASFRRVNVAEKKLTFEMRTKLELAFDEMESQLLEAIHHDPTLSAQFKEVLLKAKEKVTSDE